MKKYLLLLIAVAASVKAAFPQDQHLVDSLQKQLKNHNATKSELHLSSPSLYDSTEADILYALSKAYWGADPGKAMDYAKQTLELSEQIGYKKGQGNAYSSMGFVTGQKGDFLPALELHKKALKIREEIDDKNGIGGSHGNMGLIYYSLGNYPEALKNQLACLKIKEEVGDKRGMGNAYNNIAIIYADQGNEKEALKNFESCLKIMEETGNKAVAAFTSSNIGNIYHNQGNYEAALKNFLAAFKIQEEMGDKIGLAGSYTKIGNTYFAQGNYAEALKCHFASLKICEETGNKDGIATACNNIGVDYINQAKFSDAAKYLDKALAVSKEIGSTERLKTSYNGLATLDSAQGNFKQAFEHYKLYIAARDSMVNNESMKKTMQLQLQYDFDKKQVADSLKFAQEKEISEVKLQKQKALTYGGFAGIAVTVILLFFAYRNYNRQRVANEQLKQAQQQVINSEKMAAFGLMASRVSHEIQNPLNFVNNFSELAQQSASEIFKSVDLEDKKHHTEVLISNLQRINEHGRRAAGIVKQLQEHTIKGTAQEFFESQDTNPATKTKSI